MYIFHLVLLPVLLAALTAVFYKLRHRKTVDAVMLCIILATVVANGMATAQILGNNHLDLGVYMLQASLSCIIVPACYAYFSHVLGNRIINETTIAVSLLVLLILVPDICIVEGLSNAGSPGSYNRIVPHSINVIRNSVNVFHITIESFIIILQALIVLGRIIALDVKMHRYELVYTSKMRRFIAWSICCALFAIIYHALPSRTWAGSAGAWLYFGIYALLGVSGFLGIARNMEFKTVVTRDGAEAVHVERFIQGNRDLSRRMRELFEKDRIYLRQGLVIDDVVAMLGTNRTYFTRMMRLEFGMSFTEYVQQSRVDYCRQRLRTTQDSIEDIAMDAGFGSASNLSRVFKKVCGQTPDAYRKQFA